jgi:uncharacterized membrane protein YkvA (DUF1232 family)
MLKAFKSQLQQLANDSHESLDKRFYKEANYAKVQEHRDDLNNFILCLPDLLEQTRIWLESDKTPSNLKKVYGYLLTYVYHSLDLLPEEDFGFWGYLDDVYFAGLMYKYTMSDHPTIEQRFNNNFKEQIDNWLEQTRQVIPQHTKNLDALFQSVLQGHTDKFDAVIVS